MISLYSLPAAFAAALAIPSLPTPEYDDAEVVTNVALTAMRADARIFAFRLELDATSSNNVSLAFGHDTDADGVLSRFEEAMCVGWDCGVWKFVNCATGDEIVSGGTTGRSSLEGRLVVSSSAIPRALEVSVGDAPAFPALAANPPRFLFDPGWNVAKVVCRGLGAANAEVDCSAANLPLMIRMR